MLTRYPLDKTGKSPTNLVRNERHTLDDNFTGNRIIFPREGEFFNNSLVVKLNGRKLILNVDYKLVFLYHRATTKLGMPVSSGFQITNTKLLGNIDIDYQVVGGVYQNRFNGLEELLKVLPRDVSNTFWDLVVEKPDAYIPSRHLHHINDVFGLRPVVQALEEIRRTIENQSVLKLKLLYDRFLKLKQYVESNLGQTDVVRKELEKALDKINGKTERFITDVEAGRVISNQMGGFKNVVLEEIKRLESIINKGSITMTDNRLHVSSRRNNVTTNNASVTYISNIGDNTDNTTDKSVDRRIFAPRVKIRFEQPTVWTVPQELDGLLAQVICKTFTNNNTEIDYIVLKAGEAIRIDIKEIFTPRSPLGEEIMEYQVVNQYHQVSFGPYISLTSEVVNPTFVESRKGTVYEPNQVVYHQDHANKKQRLTRVSQLRPQVNLLSIGTVTVFV